MFQEVKINFITVFGFLAFLACLLLLGPHGASAHLSSLFFSPSMTATGVVMLMGHQSGSDDHYPPHPMCTRAVLLGPLDPLRDTLNMAHLVAEWRCYS